jgi:hypothetical protein
MLAGLHTLSSALVSIGTEMTSLATFICVWDRKTNEPLFEGLSTTVGLKDVRSVVGRDAFPEDPEMIAVHLLSRVQGMELIALMGLRFDGDGEFQVSREFVEDPTPHAP